MLVVSFKGVIQYLENWDNPSLNVVDCGSLNEEAGGICQHS